MYFIGFCFYAILFYFQMAPVQKLPPLTEDKIFIIQEGQGLKDIVANLEREGLIKSQPAFKFYLLMRGRASNINPGQYNLSSGFSSYKIANIITDVGFFKETTITIPEGWTIKTINTALRERGVLFNGSLLDLKISNFQNNFAFLADATPEANLEGFLFPDTYRFEINSSPTEVAEKFLVNFGDKFSLEMMEEAVKNDKSIYEVVKIASLIEAEVPFTEDKPKVADIIEKRLKDNMILQIDASLVYEKCFIVEADDCRTIFKSDLKSDSPYNTYTRKGLPIGPISNPGIASLRAVLWPEKNGYWYYLSDPQTKETIFSSNLAEHNRAVSKYLSN